MRPRWADPWFSNGQLLGADYPYAEVYDPVTGTFQALPGQDHIHPTKFPYYPGSVAGPGMMWSNHPNGGKVLRLPDGKVWFTGGVGGWWGGLNQQGLGWDFNEGSDLFVPETNLFAGLPGVYAPPANAGSRLINAHHAMELLQDGRVFMTKGLVLGSYNGTPPARAGKNVGILDSATGANQDLGPVL